MYVVMRPESPTLAPFVTSLGYYEVAVPHGLERVLPTAESQLLINLRQDEVSTFGLDETPAHRVGGAAVQGPTTRPALIDTAHQEAIVTVGFRPGGTRACFGVPPSAYADDLVALEDLWGSGGALLRERLAEAPNPKAKLRLVEAVLVRHLADLTVPDPAVAFAAAAFDAGGSGVATVADRVGLTPRTLTRRFTDSVGLKPKRFARVRRLQRLLRTLPAADQVDWALTAAEHGYYDQAHLINEFRELTGITPTAYRPRDPAERNHVPLR